jgi:hypothetical protein
MNPRSDIRDWGVDTPDQRPGIPRETEPRRVRAAWWDEPERQAGPDADSARPSYKPLTPVFGTAQPACGLSGLVRKAAYQVPEYKTVHWMGLLLADRISWIEWRLGVRSASESGAEKSKAASLLVPLGTAAAGMFVARRFAGGRAARKDTRRVERERKIHAEHRRDAMPVGWRIPAHERVAYTGRPTHS